MKQYSESIAHDALPNTNLTCHMQGLAPQDCPTATPHQVQDIQGSDIQSNMSHRHPIAIIGQNKVLA